ncbi:MAG TPA: SRPBCC family protein, partial [Nocardioides sp.]|nr:SRPBCC family protein [Nocardioides sp.]
MNSDEQRVVTSSLAIAAPAETIFELIADPERQPTWDGNDNLAQATSGQRVHAVGDVFTMTLTMGQDRENHVVEFEEGRRIAWRPSEVGRPPLGHLWRWELEPREDGTTLVTHTYDWTDLTDEKRLSRARATTEDKLAASLHRLAGAARAMGLPGLFAGISVAHLDAATAWYERLFGEPATFRPNDVEAVWELAPQRSVYVELRPEHAGHGLVTVFVDDLAERVAAITGRGLVPHLDETYDNGVRKVTYR